MNKNPSKYHLDIIQIKTIVLSVKFILHNIVTEDNSMSSAVYKRYFHHYQVMWLEELRSLKSYS